MVMDRLESVCLFKGSRPWWLDGEIRGIAMRWREFAPLSATRRYTEGWVGGGGGCGEVVNSAAKAESVRALALAVCPSKT